MYGGNSASHLGRRHRLVCQGIGHHLPVICNHFLRDERQDVFEIAWFSHAVVVTTVGEGTPDFALGIANGKQLGHVGRAVLVSLVYTGMRVGSRTEQAHPSIHS